MSRQLGMNCKAYLAAALLTGDTPGDASGADWDEMSDVKDVTLNLTTGEADVTTRANNGWKQTLATLKDGSVDFEMIWDPDDPEFATMFEAWLASEEVALAFMDGDITENDRQGLVGNFVITNMSRAEPLEEAVTCSVTVKPSSETQWYVVGASS